MLAPNLQQQDCPNDCYGTKRLDGRQRLAQRKVGSNDCDDGLKSRDDPCGRCFEESQSADKKDVRDEDGDDGERTERARLAGGGARRRSGRGGR